MIGGISGVGSYGMGYVSSFYQSRLAENLRNAQDAQRTRQGGVAQTAKKAASPETPVQPVGAARAVSRNDVSLPELASRLENDPAAMAGRMRIQYGEAGPDGRFVETGKNAVQGAALSTLEGKLNRAEDALAKNDLDAAGNVLKNPVLPEQEEEIPALPGQEEKALPGQKSEPEALDGETAQGAESARKALEEGECETCENRKYQDGSDDMGVSFQTPTNIKPEQAASAVRGHEMEHVYREQAKAEREDRKVVSQNVTMHTEICPECGKSYVSGGTTRTVTKADTGSDTQQDAARQSEQNQKLRTPFSAVA